MNNRQSYTENTIYKMNIFIIFSEPKQLVTQFFTFAYFVEIIMFLIMVDILERIIVDILRENWTE